MSFTINSRLFADTEISGLEGQKAIGFHRLTIRLKVALHQRKPEDQVVLTHLTGELNISGAGQEGFVGRLIPRGGNLPIQTYEHASAQTLQLDVELDRRRLEAIEEIRVGGDLTLGLFVHATATHQGRTHQLQESMNHRVNQGTWVEVLNRLGYSRTMLLEVPIFDATKNPELAKATEHLSKAHKQMLAGHDREAVGCCRDAIEALEVALKDSAAQLPQSERDWDKQARLLKLRKAMKNVCHPARHADEVSARFEWTRDDSVSMIALVTAMLRWVDGLTNP